jgi:hypothetical protein
VKDAEARNIPFADRIEHAAADGEARVDPIRAFLGLGVRGLAGHQILDIARREEEIVRVGGKHPTCRLRTVDLLERIDVGTHAVPIRSERRVVLLGAGRRTITQRLADDEVQVVQVPRCDLDRLCACRGAGQHEGGEGDGARQWAERVVQHLERSNFELDEEGKTLRQRPP